MDSLEDIRRDKYNEWKREQYFAMERECENCDSHITLGCPFYDETEETFDFEECFRVRD